GVFEASINGCPASADVLEPGYTDYARRAEFCCYDVTHLFSAGDNVVIVELGSGPYRSQRLDDRWTKIKTRYGDLAACATLTLRFADGTTREVRTGSDWGGTLGRTRSSNWTGGEDYDATVDYDPSAAGVRRWPRAVPAQTPPALVLTAKATPPLRVREVITPAGSR